MSVNLVNAVRKYGFTNTINKEFAIIKSNPQKFISDFYEFKSLPLREQNKRRIVTMIKDSLRVMLDFGKKTI